MPVPDLKTGTRSGTAIPRRSDPERQIDRFRPATEPQSAYAGEAEWYDFNTAWFHYWRRRLVSLLPLRPHEVVLDVGCGTGLCFPLLQERIGPHGAIIGIEPSPDMLAIAARRVADAGWRNVVLLEATAEEAKVPYLADHVLFCAVHDVLQSADALRNVLARTRPGGWVAAGGGKWAPPWATVVNAVVAAAHARYVRSFAGFDRPWRLLAEEVTDLHVEEVGMGGGYLALGRALGARTPGAAGATLITPETDIYQQHDAERSTAGKPLARA